jgi:ferredoxin
MALTIVREQEKKKEKRKRKPKILAIINDACTGCSGSPICVTECPIDDCMNIVPNPDAPVFIRIEVNALNCIGCKKCISKGPMDTYLEGCPWDAIDMVPLADFETKHGVLEY